MTIFVQFSDATKSAITSVFACEQDPDEHPHQGNVDESDPRYLAFIEACPFLEAPID
jgi:hypothetical protein